VAGVEQVERVDAIEPGPDVATYHLTTGKDVREQVTKAVVEAGFGVLELTRGERELERVFVELSRPTAGVAKKRKRRRAKARLDKAPAEAPAEAAAETKEEDA
jgi:hypothetical protein